jgi:hypothetical protein
MAYRRTGLVGELDLPGLERELDVLAQQRRLFQDVRAFDRLGVVRSTGVRGTVECGQKEGEQDSQCAMIVHRKRLAVEREHSMTIASRSRDEAKAPGTLQNDISVQMEARGSQTAFCHAPSVAIP